ncbi:uncharacterized protein CLUP02_18398 [Colletotrichum lupini]|uniref:Uncharacterized protein n=1 Tax=Colletotrichum lupini TaxID=145971 RepID=A0A9Q8WAR0_9PEZI|nr:uncharacterized protein CLUP02_18398 [Colletotrichum lupini]UQC76883.1 hypothetical protein CLUP02_18398 [Colletotrichum lupini]
MCPTNDEEHICDQSVTYLAKAETTNFSFGASCKKAMMRHIIANRLTMSELKWKKQDELMLEMRYVRPDGSSWGAAFDRVALPRIKAALQGRRRILVNLGATPEKSPTGEWAPWVDGFLHPDWSGVAANMSREVGESLLEDWKKKKKKKQEKKNKKQGTDDNDNCHPNKLAASRPSSAIIDSSFVLGPDDSVSMVGVNQRGSRGIHARRVEEIEQDLFDGARQLFQATLRLDRLRYDTPPSLPRPIDAHNGDTDEQEVEDTEEIKFERAERWHVVRHLICLERELDDAWRRQLFGKDHEDMEMPSGIVGMLWLNFLGADEDRFLLSLIREDFGGFDVESVAARVCTGQEL